MADSDGTAIDVVDGRINLQRVTTVQTLGSEGFIQLDQVDIVHGQTVGLQQLGHCKHRTNAHFIGFTTGNGPATEVGHRLKTELCSTLSAHDQGHRRTVRQLRGVTRSHRAVFFEGGWQLGQALECRLRTVTFVADALAVDDCGFLGFLIDDFLPFDLHRHNFIVKQAGLLGSSGSLLTLEGKFVLVFAADVVATRDDFCCVPHRHKDIGGDVSNRRVGFRFARCLTLPGRNRFNPTGNHDVGTAAGNLGGSNRNGVQAG